MAQQDALPKPDRRMVLSWAFIAGVCAAIGVLEWVFVYQNQVYGIVAALGLAVAIYVIVSLPYVSGPLADCGESLALIPLYLLFTSSIPLFFFRQDFWLPVVYSIILGLCFWHIYVKNITLADLGAVRRGAIKYVLLAPLAAIPLGITEYLVLTPPPAFPSFQPLYLVRDLVYMLVFVGLAEELLFRGLVQRDLVRFLGPVPGIVIASLLFMIMHLSWRSWLELVFVFVAGLVLGIVYHRTRSLVGPIMIHALGNVMLVGVLPYLLRWH